MATRGRWMSACPFPALSSAQAFPVSCSPSAVSLLGCGDAGRRPDGSKSLASLADRALDPLDELRVHFLELLARIAPSSSSPGSGASSRASRREGGRPVRIAAGLANGE